MKTRIKTRDSGESASAAKNHTQLLSLDEAAGRLGVCRKTVENLLARKQLKRVSVLRRRMVSEKDLELFISKQRS